MAKDKHLNAGMLDRMLTLLRPDQVRLTSGETDTQFVPVSTNVPYGRYDTGRGRENTDTEAKVSEGTETFLLRYRDDIAPNWRVQVGNVTYLIEALAEGEGRRHWLLLTVKRTDRLNPAT